MAKNKQDKNYLRMLSARRQARGGVPNFGLSEEKVLRFGIELDAIKKSNNDLVKVVGEMQKIGVAEKAVEAHYMMQTICALLVEKKICTDEDIKSIALTLQETDLGLKDKADGIVAHGDTMLIKFRLFDGDKLVADQSQSPLAYVVGSGGLPGEDAMIGMRVNEQKMIDVTFNSPTFAIKAYIGKPLRMQLACVAVKVKVAQKAAPVRVPTPNDAIETGVQSAQA